MQSKSKLILAALGLVAVLAWVRAGSDAPEAERDRGDLRKVLVNRVWIDHLPRSFKDKIHVLALVGEQHMGVFQHTSAFEGDFAAFQWSLEPGTRLGITMLQSDAQHSLRVRVATEGCGGFDYCMRVKGAPRGAKRYVSQADWVISAEGLARVDARDPAALRELLATWLDAHLAASAEPPR